MKTIAHIRLLALATLLGGASFAGGCTPLTFNVPLGNGMTAVYATPRDAPFMGKLKAPQDVMPVEPDDDLALGKRHFAETNYGLAEQHFRRAVEKATGSKEANAEAWLGLAASYDRLKRFDLADRAYENVQRAVGPTAEVLNNRGYSFMLRKDYKRARATFALARRKDPENPYVLNNLALLNESERRARPAFSP